MFKKALAGAIALAFVTSPASALKINLIDAGGVTGSPAEQGFKVAARYWESVLTNDATVNIATSYGSIPGNRLETFSTNLYTYVPINTYYGLLDANTNKSALDLQALAALPTLDPNGSVSVTVPDYYASATMTGVTGTNRKRTAPSGEAISDTIGISSANVKALINDPSFASSVVDARIGFTSSFPFDFDPTDGIGSGSYDFIGLAVREIGHAMGFLSGVEAFDAAAGSAGSSPDSFWWGYSADLFRYSAPSKLDWTFGTSSYFSLDRGVTAYRDGYLSTGSDHGDGWEAQYWKEPDVSCGDFRGIESAYICSGKEGRAKSLDLALLDAIGWNTNVDVAANPTYSFSTADMYRAFAAGDVPEPGTWAMMLLGFGLVGAATRHRRYVQVSC